MRLRRGRCIVDQRGYSAAMPMIPPRTILWVVSPLKGYERVQGSKISKSPKIECNKHHYCEKDKNLD